MIVLRTTDNRTIEEGISNILKRVVAKLKNDFGKTASESMTDNVKQHLQQRFPASKHFDPNKVSLGDYSKDVGVTNVDIPGATRAYGDVLIKPVRARALTIPIHSSAYGKKAADFKDLFKLKGKNILAQNQGGHLVALFALAKSAFQKKDSTIMPSDDNLASQIFTALCTKL